MKLNIRARHHLNFRKGDKMVTETKKVLKFLETRTIHKMVTHYVFVDENGHEISFKMNVFPFLTPMNLAQNKRDSFGHINILTHEFLLFQLRELKKLKAIKPVNLLKVA